MNDERTKPSLDPEADRRWYEERGCAHAHCPRHCDKPQPMLIGGKMYCMRCLTRDGVFSEMIPCTPEVCD